MSEGEHKASVQHTPAEWTSSNQDQYVNADKARYNSEKVIPDVMVTLSCNLLQSVLF